VEASVLPGPSDAHLGELGVDEEFDESEDDLQGDNYCDKIVSAILNKK